MHFRTGQTPRPPWTEVAAFFARGRDAIRALGISAARTRRWRRLLVPSYYSPEVIREVAGFGIPVERYPESPDRAEPALQGCDLRTGDAALVQNLFGLREQPALGRTGVTLIEDHSHDPFSPWARRSRAAYCFASLRNTLDVPGGGVLWSPRGEAHPGTPAASTECEAGLLGKLFANTLEEIGRQGIAVEARRHRALSRSSEEILAEGPVSGLPAWNRQLLTRMPADRLRLARLRNFTALAECLDLRERGRLLRPIGEGAVPSCAAILLDEPARRDEVRRKLEEQGTEACAAWELSPDDEPRPDKADLELSRRILCLSLDGLCPSDIERLANHLHLTLAL